VDGGGLRRHFESWFLLATRSELGDGDVMYMSVPIFVSYDIGIW
jgi:hypothetical protein